MPFRNYLVKQKCTNKHGDVRVYAKIIRKWIKSKVPYKPQNRGPKREPVVTRFGFLDMYNRKEQQEMICPSGYSLGQCFNVLRKLWYAYRRAKGTENDIIKMKKYAKAIQDVQKDMGMQTASFPDLELYGDLFVRNDKNGKRIIFEVHSVLKKEQEEYEKWEKEQAKNSKKIQRKLQKPNKEKGEDLVTFVDDVSPADVTRAYLIEEGEPVLNLLEPDEEKGEQILTIVDNIPFRSPHRWQLNRKEDSTLSIADDIFPYQRKDGEIEETVPILLKSKSEEKILVISDDIPF